MEDMIAKRQAKGEKIGFSLNEQSLSESDNEESDSTSQLKEGEESEEEGDDDY